MTTLATRIYQIIFYVWLRRGLDALWPSLFRRIVTPKENEVVATPYRHGGEKEAEAFFMEGMSDALKLTGIAARSLEPLAIDDAFKQTESALR